MQKCANLPPRNRTESLIEVEEEISEPNMYVTSFFFLRYIDRTAPIPACSLLLVKKGCHATDSQRCNLGAFHIWRQ